jgi:hypothetical protein
MFEEALQVWVWDPVEKEKKRLADLLGAIALLKDNGLCGIGVVGTYHVRRVAPLMACALPLYEMKPGASLDGTVLAQEMPRHSEVEQRISESVEQKWQISLT